MLLALLAFLGGALTIISPCILPVLPFVFARQGQSFARSTLPLLAGMAITFAAIGTLAAVGGAWAVRINSYGRTVALVLLAAFGVALLSRSVADWIARPFVALGNRMVERAGQTQSIVPSLVLGVATGFLWAPCAGPILGLILTGAAITGPNAQTTLLLFAYALGAIASLALAVFAGSRIFQLFRRSLGAADWVRRGLGVAVLVGVLAIAMGWDTGLLTRISFASTNSVEQSLIDAFRPAEEGEGAAISAMRGANPNATGGAMSGANSGAMAGGAMRGGVAIAGSGTGGDGTGGGATNSGAMNGGAMNGGAMAGGAMSGRSAASGPPVEGELPPLDGAVAWLNSKPLTPESLRGKVVMIDFWTYSCINCLRTLPYLRTWNDRYKDHGLVIIGVHTPEFAFEKNESNVRRAVKDLGIQYPVAIDNDYKVWRAFHNQYWPAPYFIDASGRIRGHHFGEGEYDESEKLIRELLAEAGNTNLPPPSGQMKVSGVEAAPDENSIGSPETYIGYERAEHFISPTPMARDLDIPYDLARSLSLNQWGLGGSWNIGPEYGTSTAPGGKIVFRFHARDLHLVLGPGADGKPVRFRVTIDGREPARDHGIDIDEHGNGVVREQRLYQLIRQSGPVQDHTFAIEFLDAGVQAYSFTFG
jgi:cytochrome c biogenesis protein CcdA/thiol-disulfide isomerase/thioredoxin